MCVCECVLNLSPNIFKLSMTCLLHDSFTLELLTWLSGAICHLKFLRVCSKVSGSEETTHNQAIPHASVSQLASSWKAMGQGPVPEGPQHHEAVGMTEVSLGGKLYTSIFIQLIGNVSNSVIFHKPLVQWSDNFPKLLLLVVREGEIYQRNVSKPAAIVQILTSTFFCPCKLF